MMGLTGNILLILTIAEKILVRMRQTGFQSILIVAVIAFVANSRHESEKRVRECIVRDV